MHCNRYTNIRATFSQIGRHPKGESGYGKVNADLAFLMVSSARSHMYHSPPVQDIVGELPERDRKGI
jgi:hypothetical protein